MATNPFKKSNGCTYYAWEKMYAVNGLALTFSQTNNRDAGKWFSIVTNATKIAKTTPTKAHEKTIACYSDNAGGAGHVAFIDSVDVTNKKVTVSEYYVGAASYPVKKTRTFDEFYKGSTNSNWTFQGYLKA